MTPDRCVAPRLAGRTRDAIGVESSSNCTGRAPCRELTEYAANDFGFHRVDDAQASPIFSRVGPRWNDPVSVGAAAATPAFTHTPLNPAVRLDREILQE
jgi:hypothetical protein